MASTIATSAALGDLFSNDPPTVDEALEFIARLTCDSGLTCDSATSSQQFLTSDPRVIPRVLAIFRAGNLKAIPVLGYLAKGSAAVQTQIAEADDGFVISALVRQLAKDPANKSNETSLADALEALASLADHHASNQERIICAGGIGQATQLLQHQADAMQRQVDKINEEGAKADFAELRYSVVDGAANLLRALACGNAAGHAAIINGGVGIETLLRIVCMPFADCQVGFENIALMCTMNRWRLCVAKTLEQLMSHPDASAAVFEASGSSISQLVREASNYSIQAVMCLGLLGKSNTRMQDVITRKGGVAALLNARSYGINTRGCANGWALGNLADKNAGAQLEIVEQGGIGYLLSRVTLVKGLTDSAIVELLDACALASERHAEAIARAGGFPYLTARIGQRANDKNPQWTLSTLQRVLFTGHDKHDNIAQTMFGNLGGIDALKRDPSRRELLRKLASRDRPVLAEPELLVANYDRKCVEWMMPSIDYVEGFASDLQNTDHDPGKKTQRILAARALANLACNNPANRVLIANTGVFVALVRLLSSQDDDETAAVAKAIRNLANDDVNRDAFGLLNVVPPLVKILKSGEHPKSIAAAASALGSLASKGHTANQQAIAKHGGIPALVELIREDESHGSISSSQQRIQDQAVKTLWVLAKDSSVHRKAIVEAGGITPVDEFLKKNRFKEDKVIYWATRLKEIL